MNDKSHEAFLANMLEKNLKTNFRINWPQIFSLVLVAVQVKKGIFKGNDKNVQIIFVSKPEYLDFIKSKGFPYAPIFDNSVYP